MKRIFNKIKYIINLYLEKKDYSFRIKEFNRLKKDLKNFNQIKLHFGCGPRILKDWINIDLSFEPYEKYLKYYTNKYYPESIRGGKNDFYAINIIKTGLPLPDNSVDLIFHEDFIEHLDQKEQIIFLSETFRVLKYGGIHRINTPNLIKSMEKSNFKIGKNGIYIDEWNKNSHKNVLTTKTLSELSEMIGYNKILYNGKNKSISKKIPLEYRPAEDRSEIDGNIFADLIK